MGTELREMGAVGSRSSVKGMRIAAGAGVRRVCVAPSPAPVGVQLYVVEGWLVLSGHPVFTLGVFDALSNLTHDLIYCSKHLA